MATRQPGRRYGPLPKRPPSETGNAAPMSSRERKGHYCAQRGGTTGSYTSGMTPPQRRRWAKKQAQHAGGPVAAHLGRPAC